AAETRRQLVRPHVRAQALREGNEQLVARRVAQVVVDLLEPVEVEVEDDRVAVARPRALERPVHARLEQAPVGEPRQGVVLRLVAELRLELGQLRERLLELLVLEQERRVSRERPQELLVLGAERAQLLVAVSDEQEPERPPLAVERRRDQVVEAALGTVRDEGGGPPVLRARDRSARRLRRRQ